jgi:hypothetical protein
VTGVQTCALPIWGGKGPTLSLMMISQQLSGFLFRHSSSEIGVDALA